MKTFTLVNQAVRQRALQAVNDAPLGWQVELRPQRRTSEQNAAQWPILEAFAEQLDWPVNGERVKISREEWKQILTAAFEGEVRIAEGLKDGHVMLGQRTSLYSKTRFSEWLEFLNQIAADRGVVVLAGQPTGIVRVK